MLHSSIVETFVVQVQHDPYTLLNSARRDTNKTKGNDMAYTTMNRSASRFRDLRATLSDTIARRRTYRQTVHELTQLSDRELADLGIARSMIRGIATETAYRR